MITVLESLNSGLRRALSQDERVLLFGEDLLDPYGGSFKVTRGLSDAFPGQVLPTPISEAGIVGAAVGMALRGLRPVVEIMFGDFITLAADQLINHAGKFHWMYADQAGLPLVVRTPMGGRRGYGPTHSQTLEKLFLGVPGLRVVAPAALPAQSDSQTGLPGELLLQAICRDDDPVLFVENKLLYLAKLPELTGWADFQVDRFPSRVHSAAFATDGNYPCYRLALADAPAPVVTLVAYGYMAELARQAALQLAFEHEIFCELIVPTQLAPFDFGPIVESARLTGRLLTIEEGTRSLGWGAEILAGVQEALGDLPGQLTLRAARRVAAQDLPVAASASLEQQTLPQIETIVQTVQRMV